MAQLYFSLACLLATLTFWFGDGQGVGTQLEGNRGSFVCQQNCYDLDGEGVREIRDDTLFVGNHMGSCVCQQSCSGQAEAKLEQSNTYLHNFTDLMGARLQEVEIKIAATTNKVESLQQTVDQLTQRTITEDRMEAMLQRMVSSIEMTMAATSNKVESLQQTVDQLTQTMPKSRSQKPRAMSQKPGDSTSVAIPGLAEQIRTVVQEQLAALLAQHSSAHPGGSTTTTTTAGVSLGGQPLQTPLPATGPVQPSAGIGQGPVVPPPASAITGGLAPGPGTAQPGHGPGLTAPLIMLGLGPSVVSTQAGGQPAEHQALGLGPSVSSALGINDMLPPSNVTPLNNQMIIQNNLAQQFSGGIGSLAPLSAPLPLDYAVNDAQRKSIWSNSFIDFGDLLHPLQRAQMAIAVKRDNDGSNELCLVPGTKKTPKSISEWQSAFAIYVVVYTKQKPGEVGALLKYNETVRKVAARGGDFNFYDTTFRKLRQTIPLPWDYFHTELFSESIDPKLHPTSSNASTTPPQQHPSQFPKGYCFRFHNGQACQSNPCRWNHQCFRCHKGHPIYRCGSSGRGSDDHRAMNESGWEPRGGTHWESQSESQRETRWESPRGHTDATQGESAGCTESQIPDSP